FSDQFLHTPGQVDELEFLSRSVVEHMSDDTQGQPGTARPDVTRRCQLERLSWCFHRICYSLQAGSRSAALVIFPAGTPAWRTHSARKRGCNDIVGAGGQSALSAAPACSSVAGSRLGVVI